MSALAALRPVIGVLALLSLLLLIYIGIGINAFGGLLMQPARKADLVAGGSVFVTVPWRSDSDNLEQISALERVAREETKVPAIIEELDATRRLEYNLDVRTGFSNFASAYDPNRPKMRGAIQSEVAVGDVAVTHVVPRSNFNTFFFAMTCCLQVVFNKQWAELFWASVEQVGFYNCWYYYSLVAVGNWLLLSISFAIIITTTQRQSVHERYQQLHEDSPVVTLARQLYAAVLRNNFLRRDYVLNLKTHYICSRMARRMQLKRLPTSCTHERTHMRHAAV